MGKCIYKMGLRLIIPLALSLILSSCAFDDDDEYAARTRASFFLVEDTAGTALKIIKLEDGVFYYDWQRTATGLSLDSVNDLYVDGNTAWVTGRQSGEGLGIDLREETIKRKVPCIGPPQEIRMICADDNQVAMSFVAGDTAVDSVLLFSKFNSGGSDLNWSFPERVFDEGIYKGGKFYLRSGTHEIFIYSEAAAAEITRLKITDTIIQMFFTSQGDVQIMARNGTSYIQSRIDANANEFSIANQPSPGVHRLLSSPWLNQTYGMEYLLDVMSGNNKFIQPSSIADSVSHFEVDFFSGTLFYTWRDSMTVYDLHGDTAISRSYFPWKIRKAFHYVDVQ